MRSLSTVHKRGRFCVVPIIFRTTACGVGKIEATKSQQFDNLNLYPAT